jgi:hypothetical protein
MKKYFLKEESSDDNTVEQINTVINVVNCKNCL